MLGGEVLAFVESGCALIVGLVAPDGLPFATRGWGLEVLDADRGEIRLLLGAGEVARLSAGELAGTALAVTGADVRTLHSVQLKGVVTGLDAPTRDDLARSVRYQDEFFEAVGETDRTPREVLDRLVPDEFVAALVTVSEAYDQTPGPKAGGPLAARS